MQPEQLPLRPFSLCGAALAAQLPLPISCVVAGDGGPEHHHLGLKHCFAVAPLTRCCHAAMEGCGCDSCTHPESALTVDAAGCIPAADSEATARGTAVRAVAARNSSPSLPEILGNVLRDTAYSAHINPFLFHQTTQSVARLHMNAKPASLLPPSEHSIPPCCAGNSACCAPSCCSSAPDAALLSCWLPVEPFPTILPPSTVSDCGDSPSAALVSCLLLFEVMNDTCEKSGKQRLDGKKHLQVTNL